MPEHRARQHHALDVGAQSAQVVDAVPVVHAHDVLFDDRALVELLGDEVRGGADEFDAALPGLAIRRLADERRQGTSGGC